MIVTTTTIIVNIIQHLKLLKVQSHLVISATADAGVEILNGLQFTLVYDPAAGRLYTNDLGNEYSDDFRGYRIFYEPSSGSPIIGPVVVSPSDVGDTSGLIADYGFNATLGPAEGAEIDDNNLLVLKYNADFSEGIPSINDGRILVQSNEEFFDNYVSNLEGLGAVWDPNTNPDFSYSKINVIGLEEAHSSGWTGSEVKIRVIDNFDPITDFAEISPYSGLFEFTHGANTFAISNAVAPEATFVLNQLWGSDGWKTYDATVSAVNLSFGVHITDYPNPIDGRLNAASFVGTLSEVSTSNPNAVIVESAGNNGTVTALSQSFGCEVVGGRNTADSCTDIGYALLPNYYQELDRTIFVGAYDSDMKDLASYSVSAGNSMDHFLVTDGNSLLDSGSGTSYAAPRVTGAVALVAQKFPELTASERKKIILHTADDLGAPGVDAVYGHGLLNVKNALNPIGKLH